MRHLLASMRPRVFPAEDVHRLDWKEIRQGASMRPRVFPAEDCFSVPKCTGPAKGFNEAAGIPRGRREGANALHDSIVELQ